MWVPGSAEEIEQAARDDRLTETSRFDAKAALPDNKKNGEIAKDIAAMATDGGVLLYGVAEDENGNPTKPAPFTLNGAAERISQIVATSIAEVPFIELLAFSLPSDPSRGYLAVVVPQSPRAPHMVIVGNDNRYYGRDATGNRRLNEGDVARLYHRRESWAVDRMALLKETIQRAPVPPTQPHGYIHAFARPVAPEDGMYERAAKHLGDSVYRRLIQCAADAKLTGEYAPTLASAGSWRRHSADSWRLSTQEDTLEAVIAGTTVDPVIATARWLTHVAQVDFYLDGSADFFCGRATHVREPGTAPLLMDVVIAGGVEAFVKIMGMLYEAAGYHGAVDLGVAVTGIEGAVRYQPNRPFSDARPYPSDEFKRTAREPASRLVEADVVAYTLLGDLLAAVREVPGWNPWDEASSS